jgi:hypothetical protein
MTPIRGLAVDISNRVVRWAAPGCKEWAEGLAREVEFIDSDWRALAWALGSARVLLDRADAPIDSLEKAVAAAESYFEKKKKQAQVGFLLAALALVFLALLLLQVFNAVERVAEAIVLAGLLYGIYGAYTRRMHGMESALNPCEMITKYRSELQRAYAYKHGRMRRLVDVVGLMLLFAQMLYVWAHGHDTDMFIVEIFVPAALVAQVLRLEDRKNLLRIEELTSLLARGA